MPTATTQLLANPTIDRLAQLGPAGRLDAYRRGGLTRSELWRWARRYPHEVPTINGELEWIGVRLADLD
jgi:hypothetical protein